MGGKFVLVMPNGENLEERIVYDQMRREERWRDLLDKTRSVITVAMAGPVFSTLIGRGMSRLGSHWSRASSLMP